MVRLFIAFIIFAGATGIFLGLTIPMLNAIKEDSAKSAMMTLAITKYQELEKKRNDVVAKYSSVTNEDDKKIKDALPAQINAVNLIAQIDDMVKARGMVLKRIDVADTNTIPKKKPAKGAEVQKYNTASVVFSVAGSYEVFLSLLSDLEKSLQIIDITDITFSAGVKVDSYDFNVRASTYYAGNQ